METNEKLKLQELLLQRTRLSQLNIEYPPKSRDKTGYINAKAQIEEKINSIIKKLWSPTKDMIIYQVHYMGLTTNFQGVSIPTPMRIYFSGISEELLKLILEAKGIKPVDIIKLETNTPYGMGTI